MKKVLEFLKKHKKAVIIIAILAVVAILVVKIVGAVKNAQNLLAGMQNSASSAEIEQRDIVNSISASGKIVAKEVRAVSSTVTGVKVKQLNVSVGDQVKAGDIICLLDGENLEEQLADAKTMLNADSGRSGLDLQASNRGLNEAIADRDLGLARAEEDKNKAYQNVQEAANECQEAKDNYETASDATKAWKDAMDDAKRKLDDAKSKGIKVTEPDATVVDTAKTAYLEAFTRFETYMATIETDPFVNAGWKSTIDPANIDDLGFASKVASTTVSMIYNGSDADICNKISVSLTELTNAAHQYEDAKQPTNNANAISQNIAAAEAAYQQAKASYEAALAKEESLKSLFESKAKTVESLWDAFDNVVRGADDSKRANDRAVASRVDGVKNSQLGASTATLADKRNVDTLQEQIDGCVVAASIDGMVTGVNVLQGDMYAGGAIVTIENTSEYEVSAYIDEYDISRVEVGQEVIVKTNGTGDTEMKGQVKSIAPHAANEPGLSGVKYEVKMSILESNPDLRLDMTAKIEIICDKRENVLAVASEAIQEDEDGKFFIEVIDSGTPVDTSKLLSNPEEVDEEDVKKLQSGEKSYESHNVYVTKGIVGDYYTEISGEGLEAGMKIAIPNDDAFSDIEEYMEEAGAAGGF